MVNRFAELKRRQVLPVALAIVVMPAVGFPVALVFAGTFRTTPQDGIRGHPPYAELRQRYGNPEHRASR